MFLPRINACICSNMPVVPDEARVFHSFSFLLNASTRSCCLVCTLHSFIELICLTEYACKTAELSEPFLITQVLRQIRPLVQEENTLRLNRRVSIRPRDNHLTYVCMNSEWWSAPTSSQIAVNSLEFVAPALSLQWSRQCS